MIEFKDVKELLNNCGTYGFYYLNAIPEKKLRNARSYMNIPSNETVYGLYDSTFFGSAKEGTCFTEKKIYGRTSYGNESISYNDFVNSKISWSDNCLLVNGNIPPYTAIAINDLFVKIHKLGAPIDLGDAKAEFNKKDYQKCIDLLNAQEPQVKNTVKNDIIEYRKLYIEAYLALNNMATAEDLLAKFKREYASEMSTATFIENKEQIISDFKKKYAEDVETLKATLAKATELETDGQYKDALHVIYNQDLRNDFSLDLKKEYYAKRIHIELKAEEPDFAENSIDEAVEKNIINSTEKDNYTNQVVQLRTLLHERYLEEQREVIRKNIAMAKMFESHGVLESASDTINATISSAPSELYKEKAEAFKILVELLLSQYEYEQIYELSKFYSSLSTADNLGYDLSSTVEQHRTEHLDEFYEHLYEKAIYYMQTGKYAESNKYIQDAKSVKFTFDIRCAEINLAILELDYIKSRSLLDLLIKEKNRYEDAQLVEDSINQLECQYCEMVKGLSDMLKISAIHNNIEGVMDKEGYNGFVDLEGLNLPSIAARFANSDILATLEERGYNIEFTRAIGGFGIAFLAAMQLDYDSFKKFILTRIGVTHNFVINEPMNVLFTFSDEVNRIVDEKLITEDLATDMAIEKLYIQCVLFYVCILNNEYSDLVLSKLKNEKENQIALVERMKEELPIILQKIDDDCSAKCNSLLSSVSEIKSLIGDVPVSREEKAATVISELDQTIASTIEFANKNAQIMKDEQNWRVTVNTQYIDKIQEVINLWSSLDKDVVTNLFRVPSSAIVFEEYLEESGKLRLSLLGKSLEIDASSSMANALIEGSPEVDVDSQMAFDFATDSFNVRYTYSFSMGEEKAIAKFTNTAQIDIDKVIDEIAMELMLPEKEA